MQCRDVSCSLNVDTIEVDMPAPFNVNRQVQMRLRKGLKDQVIDRSHGNSFTATSGNSPSRDRLEVESRVARTWRPPP